ncbi:MAG: hypothetical protein A3F72_02555 [Bacteroidetes bacterium RIFCSPLOWO2_12_FULL_35_15]|nr:MAG: hypothetical protein A3F72_02555 [Bacteroidetes bacterium RIFCSPLOWO2_12_FULL_35_15]
MQQETNNVKTTEHINSVETSLTIIGVRKDGIIEIRFKLNEYEVDVNDQLEIHDAFLKLTNNGHVPYHILVVPGLYGSITKEAREMEIFETNAFRNQNSLAIVVHGLHQRILGKLYLALKKNKPKYPCKLFNSEELATKWILNEKNSTDN